MSILKRIINLWRISEIEVPKEKRGFELGKSIKKMFSQHAIIVDMKNPIKELEL